MFSLWSLYALVYDSISLLRPYRQMVEDVLEGVGRMEDGLDAGCGTGQVTRALEMRFPEARLFGLDATPAMLARARARCRRAAIHTGDLDQPLPYPDGCFDRVVCTNVLYALPRPSFTLREFFRVLKPGGRLVLATPRGQVRMTSLVRHHLAGGPRAWGLFLLLLPSLLLVIGFNLIIQARAKRRVYHFLERHQLETLLAALEFEQISLRETYAGQDWLAVAERGKNRSSKV